MRLCQGLRENPSLLSCAGAEARERPGIGGRPGGARLAGLGLSPGMSLEADRRPPRQGRHRPKSHPGVLAPGRRPPRLCVTAGRRWSAVHPAPHLRWRSDSTGLGCVIRPCPRMSESREMPVRRIHIGLLGARQGNYQKPWDKVLAQRENSEATRCAPRKDAAGGGPGPGKVARERPVCCWEGRQTETGRPRLAAPWQLQPVIAHPKRREKEGKKGRLAEGVEDGGRRRANPGGRA